MQVSFDSENAGSNTIEMMAMSTDTDQANMFETPSQTFRNRRSTRTNVATGYSDIEFVEPKRSRKSAKGPKVSYVKPVKKPRRKKVSAKTKFEWTWMKVGWFVCLGLMVRVVFMEGGVIDYYSMDNSIAAKQEQLESMRLENAALITEIHKIKTSRLYQKKLAREHLGVIADDEYLVLFANDK